MATSGSSSATLRATAHVFSGRPDPAWQIDPSRAAAIVRLLEAAGATDAAAPPPPALGYRGVSLSSDAGGASWTIYAGVIVEQRPRSAAVHRLDPGRRAERAVLATAQPGMLPAALLEGLTDPA